MQAGNTRLGVSSITFTCGLLSLVCLPGSAHPASAPAFTLPSIVAEHVRRHAPSGTEIARLQVELSPDGMRVRERVDGEDLEMIQSFATTQLWFVDRRRLIAHELPLASSFRSSGSTVSPPSGFLGTEPCAGAAKRAGRSGSWRGRTVDSFICLGVHDEPVAGELVERRHGIVVRRQTADGHVDELRDIRERSFEPGHFTPSPRFRTVGARELIRGRPAIVAFVEPPEIASSLDLVERAESVEHASSARRDPETRERNPVAVPGAVDRNRSR